MYLFFTFSLFNLCTVIYNAVNIRNSLIQYSTSNSINTISILLSMFTDNICPSTYTLHILLKCSYKHILSLVVLSLFLSIKIKTPYIYNTYVFNTTDLCPYVTSRLPFLTHPPLLYPSLAFQSL